MNGIKKGLLFVFLFSVRALWSSTSVSLKVQFVKKVHSGYVRDVFFTPDNSKIISASQDNTIKIWTIDGQLIRTIINPSPVLSMAINKTGTKIISGLKNGTLLLWSINGKLLRAFKQRKGVRAVSFNPVSGLILSANGKDINIWKGNGRLLRTLKGHTGDVNTAVFSPDGDSIASGAYDSCLKIWAVNGTLKKSIDTRDFVKSLAYSPDGKWLTVLRVANSVILFSPESGAVRTLKGKVVFEEEGESSRAAYSRDGKLVISVSFSMIKIWSVEKGLLKTMKSGRPSFLSIAFSPDDRKIAVGLSDGSFTVWSVRAK